MGKAKRDFVLLLFVVTFGYYSTRFLYSKVVLEHQNCSWVSYKELCLEPDAPWPTIDIVYTWVNGSDPVLAKQLRTVKAAKHNQTESIQESDETSPSRFADNEELRYSLRSIEQFAPWVRHIYLVTNGQVPNWLDTNHPKLTIVTHEQLFPNKTHLPTFSSPAIESHLHQLPGIAEHFIYFNDDVMLGGPSHPEDFKSPSDGTKVYLSWGVPTCNDGCNYREIGNGFCDDECNVALCHFDKGDCEGENPPRRFQYNSNKDKSESANKADKDDYGGMCSDTCPNAWIADGHCDNVCNIQECGFDGGDCGFDKIREDMTQLRFIREVAEYFVLSQTSSLFVDLSGCIADHEEILNGSFDRQDIIRTAILSPSQKIIDFTFYQSKTNDNEVLSLLIDIKNTKEGSNSTIEFKVTFKAADEAYSCKFIDFLDYLHDFEYQYCPLQEREQIESKEESIVDDSEAEIIENYKKGKFGFPFPLRDQLFDGMNIKQPKADIEEKKPDFITGRKLQDTFGDSLRHVDYLFSEAYGYASRKVPAHMPHMINTKIMQNLQSKYPNEWEATSSHQLRTSDDMQYSFSYFYYLINEEPVLSDETLFKFSDVDSNELLDPNELRTVVLRAFGHPLKHEKYQEALAIHDHWEGVSPREFLLLDEMLVNLREYYVPRYKNKYVTKNADDVGFLMVNQNDTQLQSKLDGIREKQHKFICLNDNIDHDDPKAKETVKLVHAFYNSLVPLRSSFELSKDKLNTHQYISDIQNEKFYDAVAQTFVSLVLFSLQIFFLVWILRQE